MILCAGCVVELTSRSGGATGSVGGSALESVILVLSVFFLGELDAGLSWQELVHSFLEHKRKYQQSFDETQEIFVTLNISWKF